MGKKIEWTEKELEILRTKGVTLSVPKLEKLLPRQTHRTIHNKRKELNIKPPTQEELISKYKFSKEDDNFILENYLNLQDKDIAKKLNFPEDIIKARRLKLDLKKRNQRKPFPKEFDDWGLKELNPKKTTEEDFTSRNEAVIKLQCPVNKKHIFKNSVKRLHRNFNNAIKLENKIRCLFCAGELVHEDENLKYKFPKLAKSFSDKNTITADECWIYSNKKYKFTCSCGDTQEYSIKRLTSLRSRKLEYRLRDDYNYVEICKKCNFESIYESEILKYFDSTKNTDKNLKEISSKDNKIELVAQCQHESEHYWQTTSLEVLNSYIDNKKFKCPKCWGRQIDETNSVAAKLEGTGILFDLEKNKNEDPNKIFFKGIFNYYFKCEKNNHSFNTSPQFLFTKKEVRCEDCKQLESSIGSLYPVIAKELINERNNKIDIFKIAPNSHSEYWFQCQKNPSHYWEQNVANRIKGYGCLLCKDSRGFVKWDKTTVISFVSSIKNYINSLSTSERYLIFYQTGFPSDKLRSNKFIDDFIKGKFPVEEIEKFSNKEVSQLDDYFNYGEDNKDETELDNDHLKEELAKEIDGVGETTEYKENETFQELPVVSVKDTFEALEFCLRSSDQEAVEYLLESAKNKLWRKLFDSINKQDVIKEIENRKTNDDYDSKVKKEFLEEYYAAEQLEIPEGYNFTIDGKLTLPNLMQLRTASRVVKDRSVGNWSGTGAGKTLSAILASRVIDSKLTLVCCPNAVVNNWKEEIETIFPGTHVQTKDFEYQHLQDQNKHKFLVLNFEAFQQQDSDDKVMELLEKTNIEFVVIDEIHFAKQKDPEKMSKRKRIINSMIAKLRETNPTLAVLGMSATPVINNLQEGIGLIEMITGEKHDDLEPKISEENCMKLHQRLMTNGLRMKIPMNVSIDIKDIEVDCSEYIDEFKALQNKWFPLNVEQITTRAKIKEILKNIKPKTLIYTHYRQDIDKFLYDEITKAGWSVGFHTGDDKSGLDNFREGTLDVLIGTSTIGTGVNGLQNVCSNLIINSMPWTNAEFEQLIGRVYRQGQKNKVNVIVPLTTAEVNGQDWSWCKSRYERIKFKKTIGDAVIDGQLPNQNIRTQAQVVQDIKKWLDRLTSGEETIIERAKIKAQFIPGDKDNIKKRIGTFGDFSKMNARWYNTSSEKLHERLSKDRVEWDHYHEMYEENRKSWTVVPMEEMIKVFSERSDYVIGDFGCGKAQIHDALKDNHVVHSFDHVAYNQNVVACDFSHTPLDNETLDHAIFCLSFMGNAIGKYLLEASRTLKLDGKIHIIEPTKTFKDIQTFEKELAGYGFGFVNINSMSDRFTYIRAEKTGEIKNPNPLIKL